MPRKPRYKARTRLIDAPDIPKVIGDVIVVPAASYEDCIYF